MFRTALLLVGLVLLGMSPARAQRPESVVRLRTTVGSLGDSARIRLFAPGLVVNDGLFLGLRGDSLMVSEADARFQVGLDEIEGLSVEGSRWQGVSAQSAAVGLVAGAAAGFFLGYFNCGDQVQECGGHARGVALRWGVVFSAAGGVVGALVGRRMHQWQEVFP